ncbi:hypothetical protein CDD83_10104 [Cordyceps sp. RAO-2017]|nr:hypothetical protein CDD83_10104 [Cordyceps sp. RAO-2017]
MLAASLRSSYRRSTPLNDSFSSPPRSTSLSSAAVKMKVAILLPALLATHAVSSAAIPVFGRDELGLHSPESRGSYTNINDGRSRGTVGGDSNEHYGGD